MGRDVGGHANAVVTHAHDVVGARVGWVGRIETQPDLTALPGELEALLNRLTKT